MFERKQSILFFFALFCCTITANAQTSVTETFCEYKKHPGGIGLLQPYLSWILQGKARNTKQVAYEIAVAGDPGMKKTVWSSGRVNSDISAGVPYGGPALKADQVYYWKVRVWDNNGKPSPWSAVDHWQMGLLQQSDWKAKWIEPGYIEDSVLRPSPLFRKSFDAGKKIRKATAYITAHGLYEAFINGKRVGDAWLTPGWTSYNKRLQYQAYDVTGLLQQGNNQIGVALGSGWYRGVLAWSGNYGLYGKKLGLLLQINLQYADGTTATVVSDDTWKSSTGAVRFSEIYDGEINDARQEQAGWNTTGFNDDKWSGVQVNNIALDNIVATENEPVKQQEVLTPKKIFRTPKGELVVDFGQNLTGFVRLKVSGNAGDTIKMYHAEVLDKQGNFYTANLRAAKQLNAYILSGRGQESFEPHFTFQGFRYIMLEGLRSELRPEQLTAQVLYSGMNATGSFTTSDSLLNQLQHNIQWGQRGNFLDVPTDCPQRDERLGWTGDAQVFSRTAAYNRDVLNFFKKWLKDVAADQLPNGSVPFVIPNVLGKDAAGSTGWADCATIIPWHMWLLYGDQRILEEQYASMKAWVGYMEANSKNDLWAKGFHFGDWLFYRPDDDNDGRSAITDKYLISQCFYAGSVDILYKTAVLLKKEADASHYQSLANSIRAAFVKEYMTPSGRLVSGSQTAYVLALQFDMLPEGLRAAAAQRLADNVKDYDYHLTTGFLGTPYLCHVLSRFGYNDLAYTLLMQEGYPGWLYPVKMGATTIWERWDGIKPDSTFQTIGMNSFNHYAYGAIGDWMYRTLAGINSDDQLTGYRKIIIRPLVNGKRLNLSEKDTVAQKKILTEVNAALSTRYGKLTSHWKIESGKLHVWLEIPVNTTAEVHLPAGDPSAIAEAEKVPIQWQVSGGSTVKEVSTTLGSGTYHLILDRWNK
ncbi:alpha-L-rhamnosidase [Flavihumibacter petaseus]|uniref:alpha-L-rhamnosidase n=1 Tax=Flavihumibacter petaseus NBRC 106054 TaxID=1220578 RepID=A0A0E9MV21_9BACT|nr:alpha-L-rhamnosidase [Flavihumibacter petaseus]GAO41597.1 alpha-L-rhamnosidase [Flavihumibacter petaseus NBRC 106054]